VALIRVFEFYLPAIRPGSAVLWLPVFHTTEVIAISPSSLQNCCTKGLSTMHHGFSFNPVSFISLIKGEKFTMQALINYHGI